MLHKIDFIFHSVKTLIRAQNTSSLLRIGRGGGEKGLKDRAEPHYEQMIFIYSEHTAREWVPVQGGTREGSRICVRKREANDLNLKWNRYVVWLGTLCTHLHYRTLCSVPVNSSNSPSRSHFFILSLQPSNYIDISRRKIVSFVLVSGGKMCFRATRKFIGL